MSKEYKTVLALYPNRYGISYAVFDGPDNLVDYGNGYVQPANNNKILKRVKSYLKYYRPNLIITRDLDDLGKRKNKRTQLLINAISELANEMNLESHEYSRTQIQDVFLQFKAKTKYQIAQKIMEWYENLKKYQTPVRKKWMPENYNSGIFDAISLVISHYYLID